MASEVNRSRSIVGLQTEQDLANALLQTEDVTLRWNPNESIDTAEIEVAETPTSKISYPWNPSDPSAESFLSELEREFSLDDWDDGEIAQRSQSFFSHLDARWSATDLKTTLAQKFVSVPQALLAAIARQAQKVVETSNSLADQLIECVQDVLPTWAEDDLQVLARPLAYAMRSDGADVVDATVNSVRAIAWSDLSETEQARMSLAIARYAIDQLGER
ncbi:hypothetical protein [Phormidesmis priestleyi]|uniref:hypothetical protein n=1 Tax=Phormidesmis priestleyi TaxID=268141 RepID=UPI000A8E1429|nr:hypothetical protein [Phormidesmis priestleyi]